MPRIQSYSRIQLAVVTGQSLSFFLIITFIFANQRYDLLSSIGGASMEFSLKSAYVAACLVGLVGAVSIWITLHYLNKSNSMRDMVVVCAWTQQIKIEGRWVPFRDFLSEQLGYAVSHGMCDEKLAEMRSEIDREWRGESEKCQKSLQNDRPTLTSDSLQPRPAES